MSKRAVFIKRTFALAFGWFLLPGTLAAQTPVRISLQDAIGLALNQGYAVHSATSSYLVSKKTLEAELRRQRTSVNLNLNLPTFRESLSSQFNPATQKYEYYQIQTTELQSGLSISQPLSFTGGVVSFQQTLLERSQINGLTTSSSTDYFSNFYLQFRQPLWTPNVYRQTSERNAIQLEQAEAEYVKDKLDITYSVTEAFYDAHRLSQRLTIVRDQVRQNEDSYQTAKNKFAGGLIPEVDYLQSEVDLVSSNNEQATTEREYLRALNVLRLLLGIPADQPVEITADLTFRSVPVDQAKAVEQALASRTEVISAERSVDLRLMDIESAEARNSFRMDILASYGINGNAPQFDRIFRDFGRSRAASLTVSIPLFDWGSNALDVEAAVVQHENAIATSVNTRDRIRLEIIDLVNRIRSTESRIQVLDKNVTVAQKSYDISMARFRAGTINRNDLAQAQQRLTTAKLNSLNALIDYQIGMADLKRRTLWDFETRSPVRADMDDKRH